ncbi:tRNA lysidine(34) synthetase TilS [Chryseomicrobium palamuruense]|uniref:tRNA(Ile)-lysidine synthase n=1 Tax=Chryseomicrobium palamuruense TaxID=682973 RepID=A0ABV8UZE2_9BACL
MEQQVNDFLKRHQMTHPGKRLLLACSGGADSVALVRSLHALAKTYNWELGIVHADHQLRGQASKDDQAFVVALGESLEIPVYAKALPVPERLQQGGNTQQVCREERYAYFASILHTYNFDVLVQGHHADDQIETVLMQLTKGSEEAVLGIPVQRVFDGKGIMRPLLGIKRTDIEQYLRDIHQAYREDASNESDAYTRNRFRHHVVPLLYKENPALDRQIGRFIKRQEEDEEVLSQLAELRYQELVKRSQNGHVTLDGKGFRTLPIALQRRVILLLWKYLQPNTQPLSSQLLATILHASTSTHGTQHISLPQGYQLTRSYDDLQFAQKTKSKTLAEHVLMPDRWVSVSDTIKVLLTQSDELHPGERWYVQIDEEDFPLVIRGRKAGDRIDYGTYQKKVARILIDQKIPLEKRDSWPLLVSQKNGILGLISLSYGKLLNKQTKTPWVIWIKQEDSTC